MAKVIVNISDSMTAFVNKTNLLSTTVGDLVTLNTTQDSDLVGAINEVFALIDSDTDFRSKISVTDAGGDGSLSYNSSTGVVTYTGPNVTEVRAHFSAGTNTTYATGSFSISDTVIRSKISVTDAGGDGSLSYNSSTGVITYTGPNATEVRAHISAGEGIDIASGVISGEDASTSNKGIASFSSTNFAAASGAISIKADGVSSTELKDLSTLLIKNAAGSTLKTLYGAGS